ncbi:hypothetical protein BDB00DRAFT_793812 [Zychaea mexicana]|uniref:uncharacterized protein n=1 Tax=Zychaea mexicana TaxID=64656 RepID=UPI0022FDB20D|nr:uncharacterized protein BDB00DRAFT_793812 [Zychaea mexicana]KAI9467667.1 hypothetical protein BDB00DRAFT_793812 [Zychaea mexicana]
MYRTSQGSSSSSRQRSNTPPRQYIRPTRPIRSFLTRRPVSDGTFDSNINVAYSQVISATPSTGMIRRLPNNLYQSIREHGNENVLVMNDLPEREYSTSVIAFTTTSCRPICSFVLLLVAFDFAADTIRFMRPLGGQFVTIHGDNLDNSPLSSDSNSHSSGSGSSSSSSPSSNSDSESDSDSDYIFSSTDEDSDESEENELED